MARNSKIMRDILQHVRDASHSPHLPIQSQNIEIAGYSQNEIMENCIYLLDDGYIIATKKAISRHQPYDVVFIDRLTASGDNLLLK